MKNFEMNLLNAEEMHDVIGGKDTTCNKTKDTISCNIAINIKLCKSLEANCSGNFSSTCNSSKVTISGCTVFSVGSGSTYPTDPTSDLTGTSIMEWDQDGAIDGNQVFMLY
jgi:hypothetical protein